MGYDRDGYWNLNFEKNRMTDYQLFRLFLDKIVNPWDTDYRLIDVKWFLREIRNEHTFLCVDDSGWLTYYGSTILNGVKKSNKRLIRVMMR